MAFEPILDLMKEMDIPLTREVYIGLNWGDSSYEPTPEEEAEMAVEFQPCEVCYSYPCCCVIRGVAGFDCECDPCVARRGK